MLNRQNNNNLNDLLSDMDPLAQKKPTVKTPAAFLGENSALVNLDNLIKPINNSSNNNAYNPFESPAMKTKNLFQQNQPQVSDGASFDGLFFHFFFLLFRIRPSTSWNNSSNSPWHWTNRIHGRRWTTTRQFRWVEWRDFLEFVLMIKNFYHRHRFHLIS